MRFERNNTAIRGIFLALALFLLPAGIRCSDEPPPEFEYGGDAAGPVPGDPVTPENIADVVLKNEACKSRTDYLVGRGMYDITGPAGLAMMGYAKRSLKSSGIHTRLRSRAFIFESPCNGLRAVFVSTDTGMLFQSVKQGVVKRLREIYGGTYNDKNIMISATHTHNGPGGYAHYTLYNLTTDGLSHQNYEVIVNGIVESINRAHRDLRPGRLRLTDGNLENASLNRSPLAYEFDPPEERARYSSNKDDLMTLLRLEDEQGRPLGHVNWFAVHCTGVGNKESLISGDNKGLASYMFEKHMGTDYRAEDVYTAAFAQSNSADVTPHIWGPAVHALAYKRNEIIARRRSEKALELSKAAAPPLSGPVDYRHVYVKMDEVQVQPRWTGLDAPVSTCKGAVGAAFAAGSKEDNDGGLSFVHEGMRYGVETEVSLYPEDQDCQAEKIIVLRTGRFEPPWTPDVLPLQIIRVGELAIIAVPFECTTMCGRRIRETVLQELAPLGVRKTVIAGLANAYSGYVVTREEYAAQHYESGSVYFGPWTHAAYMQEMQKLAESMREGKVLSPGPSPPDLANHAYSWITGVLFDLAPFGGEFGDVDSDAADSYQAGDEVRVVFRAGHPANDLMTQSSYVEVQRKTTTGWEIVARDEDPEVIFDWKLEGFASGLASAIWRSPPDITAGTYRILHRGRWKTIWGGGLIPYEGLSREFQIGTPQ